MSASSRFRSALNTEHRLAQAATCHAEQQQPTELTAHVSAVETYNQ